MSFISLNTASSLSGVSKRTLWRRIADGCLHTQDGGEPGERTLVALDDVLRLSRLQLTEDDYVLIVEADRGDAAAQCDLALLFLAQDHVTEALRWLEIAANKFYPEAMFQLGRCLIAGRGVPANESAGVDWIRKAGGFGHSAAEHLMRYLNEPSRPALEPVALDLALDAIERKVVMQMLYESADTGIA